MKWVFLAGAIALEVTGSLSLKAAVDAPGFFALVAVGYIGAFTLLAGALKRLREKRREPRSDRDRTDKIEKIDPPKPEATS